MKRVFSVDFLRGIAIIPMIIFNYSVTLGYFHLIEFPTNFLYWYVLPRLIAGTFIFVSGIAASLSLKRSKNDFGKKHFFRGVKLAIFALAITFFTYIFTPNGTIVFGILHFFAFTSFLIPFFIRNKKANLFIGIFLIILGFYMESFGFSFNNAFWLFPENFYTLDYFPLLPWLGVMMLGFYFADFFVKLTKKFEIKNRLGSLFAFSGRKSLVIYLIHQPLLILLLALLGFRIFF